MKTKIKKVSVIIPTYNRSNLLKHCIDSILNQTYNCLEIIVIDDGSTDNTESNVRSILDSRVLYSKIEKSGNLSEIRNFGISISTGEFVAFCDDDDLWLPRKLEIQMGYLSEYNVCCSNAKIINSEGSVIKPRYIEDFSDDAVLTISHLFLKNYVITSSIVIRKSILNSAPFNQTEYKNIAEDYDLWVNLSLKEPFYFVNEPLLCYKVHSSLTHNQGNDERVYKNSIDILTKYKILAPKNSSKFASLGILIFRIMLFKYYYKKLRWGKCCLEVLQGLWQLMNFKTLLLYLKMRRNAYRISEIINQ